MLSMNAGFFFSFLSSTTKCLSTHFFQIFPFYTLWKNEKPLCFLMISGGTNKKKTLGRNGFKYICCLKRVLFKFFVCFFVLVVSRNLLLIMYIEIKMRRRTQWDCLYFIKHFGAIRYHKIGFEFSKNIFTLTNTF